MITGNWMILKVLIFLRVKNSIQFGNGVGEVSIVNLLGAEVARLYEGELDAGEHSFTWDASGAAAGMYECLVRVNGNVQRVPLAHLR